jgi:hypothetical protein
MYTCAMKHLLAFAAILTMSSMASARKRTFEPPVQLLGEVHAFVVNEKGVLVPYTQDSVAGTVVIVAKIEGLKDSVTLPFKAVAVDDNSAAAAEGGKKGSRRKQQVKQQLTVSPSYPWAIIMFPVGCYDGITFSFGALPAKKVSDLLPGACGI